MPDASPIVKGTLDVLLLKALTWTPMHGFEITQWLEARSGGTVGVRDSALYQALHRMAGRGLVSSDWGVTANNQRARYYKITKDGRKWLADETAHWVRYAGAVTAILTSSPTKS